MGTPAQTFSLSFEVGSADVWVMDVNTTTDVGGASPAKNLFNGTASTSYAIDGQFYNGSGIFGPASGTVGVDNIVFAGGIQSNGTSFGQVTNFSRSYVYYPIDGAFGLAWPALSQQGLTNAFMKVASTLDQPIFTVFIDP